MNVTNSTHVMGVGVGRKAETFLRTSKVFARYSQFFASTQTFLQCIFIQLSNFFAKTRLSLYVRYKRGLPYHQKLKNIA